MTRYLLFAVIGTALFWGLYRLLLRKEHCLQLNRFFLLATLTISLSIPLIHPTVHVTQYPVSGNGYLIPLSIQGDAMPLPSPTQVGVANNIPNTRSIDTWQIIALAYWFGVALSALLLAIRYVTIRRKLHRFSFTKRPSHHGTRQRHYCYVAVDDNVDSSFSFFNHIVIKSRDLTEDEIQQVLAHELTHAQQRHSWDTLLIQLVRCLLWFNPFVWLYERELSTVHEYLADEAVLRQGNEETYSHYLQLLFKQATGIRYSPLVNSFHFLTIKNRITMMKQPKSHRGWVKALSALPVAALLLFANCKNQEPAQEQATIPDGTYLVQPFTETYRDGKLVEREFMGVIIPLDSVGEHKEFADSAEAVRFNINIHETVAKSSRVTAMMNLSDSSVNWYQVAWNDADDILDWFNKEDNGYIQLAEIPGGFEALADYIAKSIVYPEQARTDEVEGKVFVQFIVEPDGSIGDVTLLRGIGGGCDEEALRVIKAMPQWKPARFKGKPTRSRFQIPINFMLK
ncbi:MAG: M56 family metallopeptidase [Bacteroidales bacterium]|nr:M56 family metallopeptidase [Bacteroidales bacterium]